MSEQIYTPEAPRFPHIQVQLMGEDGNAFAILGRVKKALSKNGIDKETVKQYIEEATSGDYHHLLYVTTCWVDFL